MTWIPVAVSAAGTLAAGVSNYRQAGQQAGYAKANARLAEQQGESEAALIREKARRLSGENRAAIGASGVDISGSFLDALADSDIDAELDAQMALWNSRIEEKNYRTYARTLESRSRRDLMSGIVGAGTRVLNELTK